MFVDETKERGLLVAAAVVIESDVVGVRREVRKLILPGQRRIHFHKERDDRRVQILTALRPLGVRVTIYDATSYRSVKAARDACLVALVADLAKIAAARLVLEQDDSTHKADRDLLFREVRLAGIADQLRYDHMRAHEECLLAIPDAVAWSWAKGGRWRAAVRPIVAEVREV
ncbi:hypothetical protein MRQ36_10960 [Micromonospora sp. R77]|uniref:hypothetical protein n=1 Tax=Micromonospora sp. R77 TaxID=2925836 RepID=UPI001F6133F8|nr:hypothetical protein [Micromonospora sp. R77]MCI4063069.1 hypothetical protein [Micromonospora sp. R77]